MFPAFIAEWFYEEVNGTVVYRAMPVLLGALCVLALAYRYYSAFLAAKVAALDDRRVTPAHRFQDGHNYDPTGRWVLFGHHFAAIAGAGPLIGPVLAIQYGYFPGILWLVVGVCFAGAVQDMLVLAASVRRGGKSLAEIARAEIGRPAVVVVSAAILFIVIIALAGLGFVVVKALGGDEVRLAEGTRIVLPEGGQLRSEPGWETSKFAVYRFPEGCQVHHAAGAVTYRSESFVIAVPSGSELPRTAQGDVLLPKDAKELVPGSSWGTFTIACTIPIAIVMGLMMRYGTRWMSHRAATVAASVFGLIAVLASVIVGNYVPGSPLESWFSLTREQTILALTIYGFSAAVLPVWLLLLPRDYLSSFLKIGTVGLIVVGVFVANPRLECPPVNHTFLNGGPTFRGNIFPFLFICIMCGAVSGFHSLVSSGTTPKMVDKESDVRPIGYGAMLMEGLVGVVALIAAASLPQELYYDINTPLPDVPRFQERLNELYASLGIREGRDPLHAANVDSPTHLPVDLNSVERMVGGEALRGRTGGAVTLAVGMAFIFSKALAWTGLALEKVMSYWYHFAIMFEALFILTTIDAGTRIARFLLQEALGKIHPKFEQTNWPPGAWLATFLVTAGWGILIHGGSIDTIWPMFGIANQLLAVMALALVTTMLINAGRLRYAPVTLLPMLFVTSTTMTAGVEMVGYQFPAMIAAGQVWKGYLNIGLTLFVMASVGSLLLMAVSRWVGVVGGLLPTRVEETAPSVG
ncbi:MAG: carbon starvation protein A [Gemmataceae bacterium]|nr:carbon starvation protein A [Gemmataceae bacterium]MDW8266615.1 carbon starvation protein A [Gemmataceae bacterium]